MDQTNLDFLLGSSKILTFVVDGSLFSPRPLQDWSSRKPSILDKPFPRNCQLRFSGRTATRPTLRQAGGTRQPQEDTARLESLILERCSVRLWQMQRLPGFSHLRNLKRLTLVYCDNPMLLSWQRYPRDLEVLEILDPFPTYPIKAGLLLRQHTLARPLTQFRRLTELSLQNVGAPICEVLFHLLDSGKSLRVLRLHDQEISGIDRWYRFRRHQPQPGTEFLNCFFTRLLIHICPNVQILSLDMSARGLLGLELLIDRQLGSNSRSAALEPLMDELARSPTLSLSQKFQSLMYLRHLRLVTYRNAHIWEDRKAMQVAERMWSTSLESFTLVAHTPVEENELSASEDGNHGQISRPDNTMEWCVMSRVNFDAIGKECKELYLVES